MFLLSTFTVYPKQVSPRIIRFYLLTILSQLRSEAMSIYLHMIYPKCRHFVDYKEIGIELWPFLWTNTNLFYMIWRTSIGVRIWMCDLFYLLVPFDVSNYHVLCKLLERKHWRFVEEFMLFDVSVNRFYLHVLSEKRVSILL